MSNHIQNVAIIGAGGRIGGAFAEALLKTGKHTVTAITRNDSQSKLPDGVKIAKVNYDDQNSIASALKGQQFLVITLPALAPGELHTRIVDAAAEAGVAYVMPNVFGYPVDRENPPAANPYISGVLARLGDVEKSSSAPVVLNCGFWYEWSLALGENFFGIGVKDRKVTFFDDGLRTITVSTWDQCGRALAALLSLPEKGTSPSLEDCAGKQNVLIYSFQVSQRDMLDSLHRVLGTTDADWEIRHENLEERIAEGTEQMAKGDRRGFAKWLYGGVFRESNEASNYGGWPDTANEALGLPQDDLDEATKRVVAMVESGWNPGMG